MKRKDVGFARTLSVNPYGNRFYLAVDATLEKAAKRFSRWGKPTLHGDELALTFSRGCRTFVLLTFESLTHANIAHELFHATHDILEYTGDTFSGKHHEPYA